MIRVIVKGELRSYEKYEDVPTHIDEVIEFNPAYPPPPHTEEDHNQLAQLMEQFKNLMRRANGGNYDITCTDTCCLPSTNI